MVGDDGGPTALFELERSRPESRLMVPASEIRRSRRDGPDWEGTRRREGEEPSVMASGEAEMGGREDCTGEEDAEGSPRP
jgi:hypothetical protein